MYTLKYNLMFEMEKKNSKIQIIIFIHYRLSIVEPKKEC